MVLLAGMIIMWSSYPVTLLAQGNLLITPRRVVFEGTKRSMDLNLANTGQDSATYAYFSSSDQDERRWRI